MRRFRARSSSRRDGCAARNRAIVLTLIGLTACQPAPPTRRFDAIVLIVFDSLRADRLGVYGHHRDTSPFIDAFAAMSTRFERAIAPSPWTAPSMGSLFTGRWPTRPCGKPPYLRRAGEKIVRRLDPAALRLTLCELCGGFVLSHESWGRFGFDG